MNILIWTSVFHPSVGGIENLTTLLATEFVKAGHAVKVITEQAQDPMKPLVSIEVRSIGDRLRLLGLFLFWSDVFYMPNITLKGVWLLLFNPWKKWVVSHNDFHLSYSRDWKTSLKKMLVARADRNISVSQSVAIALESPSIVIRNCYDDVVFKLYPNEPRQFDFLFVGRLVSQKGCDLLIEACAGLPRPFTLNIVGVGAEEASLRSKVAALGLQKEIRFLGMLEKEPLARVMNQHRVMIVPSLSVEGFGIVALEGLACGCKMLVSNAGGLSEAITDYAKVFPMRDVVALRALMLAEYASDSSENIMPAEKAQFLREHSKQQVAQRYLEVFAA